MVIDDFRYCISVEIHIPSQLADLLRKSLHTGMPVPMRGREWVAVQEGNWLEPRIVESPHSTTFLLLETRESYEKGRGKSYA